MAGQGLGLDTGTRTRFTGRKTRLNDLRRIYRLWESDQIDGMYTLQSLDAFRRDLEEAARLRKLL